MSEILKAALRYAARAWPVLPCLAEGKVPLTPHGFNDATVEPARIREWWERWPRANVGVRTGGLSGIVVLDVDGDDGMESLRAIEREYEPLPLTASVVTPRGGSHFYLAHPGVAIPSSAGKLGASLDVRGEGGYVIAPPSVGAGGRRYEPDERAPFAPMPGWLLELLADRDGNGHKPTPASEWVSIMRDGLPDGERNTGLTRFVGYLLARNVDAHLVHEIAQRANERFRPPLEEKRVQGIVESIAGRELRTRKAGKR